ncbi:hypothetical protein DSO57_1022142 [Entomophthora muscae]|uniref:Uncharacterized protein n=1 Tax=Entomophthora muscae TaxID=34485 RepID=A0ACC2UC79_9FUNG|nr:hypothetical protein DSO57_1022142 [Entomophthora muscae]
MNVASEIIDNNLIFIKEGDLCPSASAFDSSKGNGLVSSKSLFYNINSNRLGVTLGEVVNVGEAGKIFRSILGLLIAAPAVIEAQTTSWSPPYVGLL